MTNKYDFAYSVALIRTLETLLLNENEVERMMLAKDGADAFRVLNEFDYADNKAGIENASDFQTVLDEGLLDIKEILQKITPDQRILNILLLQYDFHNIKTMLKAKLSKKSFEEIENLLSKMGAISTDALKAFIFEDESSANFGLENKEEEYLKKKIRNTYKLFEKHNEDPQIIDLYLDQKLVKMIYNIALDNGNDFLIQYVQKLIDLNNIKLLFRIKIQEKELEVFETGFLWNGTISLPRFKEAFSRDLSDLPNLMEGNAYAKVVATGYKHYEEEKSLLHLEKEAENHLTNFIRTAKLIPFGPEPLIAYLLAKRNNAMVIRMVMVNKLNEIDPEEIQPRLRNLYS